MERMKITNRFEYWCINNVERNVTECNIQLSDILGSINIIFTIGFIISALSLKLCEKVKFVDKRMNLPKTAIKCF